MAKKKLDVLEQSPNCQLPCFNGLTPGISNDWESQDFFASLGFDDLSIARDAQGRWLKPLNTQGSWDADVRTFPVLYLISDTRGEKPYLGVAWSGGRVTSIAIGFLPRRKWIDIPRFLSALDETPEVFLSEFGGEGPGYLTFYLTLIFRSHQVQVTYIGAEQGRFENRRVCMAPDLPSNVYIALGNYEMDMTPFCDMCSQAAGLDWSKNLGISNDEMVSKIKNGDFCLPGPR